MPVTDLQAMAGLRTQRLIAVAAMRLKRISKAHPGVSGARSTGSYAPVGILVFDQVAGRQPQAMRWIR